MRVCVFVHAFILAVSADSVIGIYDCTLHMCILCMGMIRCMHMSTIHVRIHSRIVCKYTERVDMFKNLYVLIEMFELLWCVMFCVLQSRQVWCTVSVYVYMY